MGNAIWLLKALTPWYFGAAANPLAAGILTMIPAVGTLCLIAGVIFAFKHKEPRTLLFAIPLSLNYALVGIAGYFRGEGPPQTQWFLLGYLVLQLVTCAGIVYFSRESRIAASLLALFSLSYALHASFIAGMAFADSWL